MLRGNKTVRNTLELSTENHAIQNEDSYEQTATSSSINPDIQTTSEADNSEFNPTN